MNKTVLSDSELESAARKRGTGGWQTLESMTLFARDIEQAVLQSPEIQRLTHALDVIAKWPSPRGDAVNLNSIRATARHALAGVDSTEIQQLRKDAERLDFMIENLAWAQSFERDGSILQYRLMTQNEDEDYVFMSGEDRYFNTPRDAIDAAMEVKP